MPEPSELTKTSAIATYLNLIIEASEKTQKQIAKEVGYEKPNVISMMKYGTIKVPFDKVPALAKALNVDAGHLMRLAIEQYWPDMLEDIRKIFGNIVSDNEFKLIAEVRIKFDNTDPHFSKAQIQAVVGQLVDEHRIIVG